MARTSRTLEVVVLSDTRDLKRGMKGAGDSTEKFEKRSKKSLGSFAKQAKFALAGVGVASAIAVGKEMLQLATTAESTEKRFDTVFGEMDDFADDMDEAMGLSTVGVKNLANEVGDLLIPLGFTRREAAEMTQETLTLANALSEWTGGQVSVNKAVEAARKAMLGEREMLKELGIAINEADVSQRLLEKGQQDLTGEALKQAKALATLEMMYERSTDAVTAYEEGGNEALRTQKELTSAWGNAKQELATALFPALVRLTEGLAASVTAGEDATTGFGALNEQFADLTDTEEDYQRTSGRTPRGLSATEEAAENATEALRDYQAELERLDPLTNYIKKVDDFNDAFQKVIELQAQGKTKSEEYRDAALDLAVAKGELEAAGRRFAAEGGQQSIDALETLLRDAGLSEEAIRDLIRAIGDFNATPVAPKRFPVGGPRPLQSGGPFRAGEPLLVGESRPEVVTFNRSGRVHPDASRFRESSERPRQVATPPRPEIIQLVVDGRVLAETIRRHDESLG